MPYFVPLKAGVIRYVLLLSGGSLAVLPTCAQAVPYSPPLADSARGVGSTQVTTAAKHPWYRGQSVRASLVPALFIGYGIYTFNGRGLYTNQEADRDIHRLFTANQTHVEDVLQYAPYAELGIAALAGASTRDDGLNIVLLLAKFEAIMLASVYLVKHLTQEQRPDGSGNLSFPSGHTAQAFLAASIVHHELRAQSQWYGIGAYTIATGVGVLRMVNEKH